MSRVSRGFSRMTPGMMSGESRVASRAAYGLRADVRQPPTPLPASGTFYAAVTVGQVFTGSGEVGVLMDFATATGFTDEIVWVDPLLPTYVSLPPDASITSMTFEIEWAAATRPNSSSASLEIASNPAFTTLVRASLTYASGTATGPIHVEGTAGYITVGSALPFAVPPTGGFIYPGFRRGTANPNLTTVGGFFTFDWTMA